MVPYALLTLGEVLVSATGLEFAYSQAPLAMKGVIMAFWSLSVTIGNLWVLVVNAGVKNESVIGFIKSSGVRDHGVSDVFLCGLRVRRRARLRARRAKVSAG